MRHSIDEVMHKFRNHVDGVNVLFLIHRSKEGGTNKGTKMYKEIVRGADEFKDKLEYLYERAHVESLEVDIPLRIYSTVNSRDMEKAIRQFKQKMLDADYDQDDLRYTFYNDVKNRWISSLMSPRARFDKKFLIDIDDITQLDSVYEVLTELDVTVYAHYDTVNGAHLITEPFNPKELEQHNFNEVSINKDGLLLLTYNEAVC